MLYAFLSISVFFCTALHELRVIEQKCYLTGYYRCIF